MNPQAGESWRSARMQWPLALSLGAIMLLGFLLRMYRLDEQSLWWDDYNGIAHLTLDGFFASMADSRRMNPEGAPLYHLVQYFASLVIGHTEYAQRLLNVMISVATIPVLFLIGLRTFGARAGLVAALLFAMSPPHLYHAQSLRIYPLAMLCGAVALLAMQRMLAARDSRAMYLNAIANGALCMTHLLGLFGVIAQGTAALLVLGKGDFRFLVRWCKVQFICLLPAALWVLTMRQRTAGDFWHFSFPDARFIIRDLFGDDLTEFAVSRSRVPVELFGYRLDQPPLSVQMEQAMLATMMLAALWAVLYTGYCLWRTKRGANPSEARTRSADLVLMICFWALPVVFLLAFAYFWWPVVYARYTLYACLGLYVLVGAFVQWMRWWPLQAVATAFLAALYAYQLALLVNSDTRTQWRAAALDIHEQAASNDMILVGAYGPPEISHRTFTYHVPGDLKLPITRSHSVYDALAQVRCHFDRKQGADPPPAAWFVYNTHYYLGRPTLVQQYLEANGLTFRIERYPAEEHLVVFHIDGWEDMPDAPPFKQPEAPSTEFRDDYNPASAAERMGLDPAQPGVVHAFQRAFEDGMIMGNEAMAFFSIFLEFDEFELAEHCLRRAEEEGAYPVSSFDWWHLHFSKGNLEGALEVLLTLPPDALRAPHIMPLFELTLWAAGEEEAAMESYARTRARVKPHQLNLLYLLDALVEERKHGPDAAAQNFRSRFLPHGHYTENLLYRMAGLPHWFSACAQPWQAGPVSPETRAAALEVIRASR